MGIMGEMKSEMTFTTNTYDADKKSIANSIYGSRVRHFCADSF
jgi:hypothetical protein